MYIRQDGELIGNFLEAEARALRKRDVGDSVKSRFAVPAVATAPPAFRRDQSELLIVTQRYPEAVICNGHCGAGLRGVTSRGPVGHGGIARPVVHCKVRLGARVRL